MEATAAELKAFAAALRAALDAWTGRDHEAATAAGISPERLSQYATGRHEPPRAAVFALERVLKLKPGALSRHLGYLPVDARAVRTFEDVVDTEPGLPDYVRRTLKLLWKESRQ